MSWISPDVHNLQQLFALNPQLETQLAAFSSALWSQPYLPATTLELCRLRIARLLQCMPEFIQRHAEVVGLSEQKVVLLNHYSNDPHFTDAERACLEFTEIYCQDPAAISDAQAAAVVQYYGDPGLVVLVQALGLFNAWARMSVLLDFKAAEMLDADHARPLL
jgi:alkylhydroperoxidase family enzyme